MRYIFYFNTLTLLCWENGRTLVSRGPHSHWTGVTKRGQREVEICHSRLARSDLRWSHLNKAPSPPSPTASSRTHIKSRQHRLSRRITPHLYPHARLRIPKHALDIHMWWTRHYLHWGPFWTLFLFYYPSHSLIPPPSNFMIPFQQLPILDFNPISAAQSTSHSSNFMLSVETSRSSGPSRSCEICRLWSWAREDFKVPIHWPNIRSKELKRFDGKVLNDYVELH